MKRTLFVTLGLLTVIGALIAVIAWEPWKSREREHEVTWLKAYSEWSDRIDRGLEAGDVAAASACSETYATQVGTPPERLVEAGRIAQRGCSGLERWAASDDESRPDVWFDVRDRILGDLTERRARAAAPAASAQLARYASPLAGPEPPKLFCWSRTHWDALNEEWAIVALDELWLLGFANPDTNSMHLAPDVCEPLHRFFSSDYAPHLNQESLDLANALVVLAHEAEHLRSPNAAEAAVECVAIQRVRDLVRAAGRGKPYEALMAGLAWDVGYPDMPEEYRTTRCHDGSDLDVRPETSVWP